MKASIIIRTKNEEKWLGTVLEKLSKQTEKDFEVIIIDSGSTDKTLNIVKSFIKKLNIKIFSISQAEFTYPFACNYGAKHAKGKYLIYLSGHSVPISNSWLKDGLKNFEQNNKIVGVFGTVRALPDASFWERIWYVHGKSRKKKRFLTKARMGIMGNTNAIYPKKLWQEHNFDESYTEGGEDGEWARYFLKKGYVIVEDPLFAVYHSHGLVLISFIKQVLHWIRVSKQK